MALNKNELFQMWESEGRLQEVKEFMLHRRDKYEQDGMKFLTACKTSLKDAAEEFPPLLSEKSDIARAKSIPWPDLPPSAEFTVEVKWVHQQFALIVFDTPRGRMIDWFKATEKAPSYGACSLALWAADNRTAFYKDVLPKAMSAAANSGDDAELIKEEKKSIAEVQRILEKITGK